MPLTALGLKPTRSPRASGFIRIGRTERMTNGDERMTRLR
jgi:hypothetical protein